MFAAALPRMLIHAPDALELEAERRVQGGNITQEAPEGSNFTPGEDVRVDALGNMVENVQPRQEPQPLDFSDQKNWPQEAVKAYQRKHGELDQERAALRDQMAELRNERLQLQQLHAQLTQTALTAQQPKPQEVADPLDQFYTTVLSDPEMDQASRQRLMALKDAQQRSVDHRANKIAAEISSRYEGRLNQLQSQLENERVAREGQALIAKYGEESVRQALPMLQQAVRQMPGVPLEHVFKLSAPELYEAHLMRLGEQRAIQQMKSGRGFPQNVVQMPQPSNHFGYAGGEPSSPPASKPWNPNESWADSAEAVGVLTSLVGGRT